MDDNKQLSHVHSDSASDFQCENGQDAIQLQKGGTQYDVHDMSRMGKKQELRVRPASKRPSYNAIDQADSGTRETFASYQLLVLS